MFIHRAATSRFPPWQQQLGFALNSSAQLPPGLLHRPATTVHHSPTAGSAFRGEHTGLPCLPSHTLTCIWPSSQPRSCGVLCCRPFVWLLQVSVCGLPSMRPRRVHSLLTGNLSSVVLRAGILYPFLSLFLLTPPLALPHPCRLPMPARFSPFSFTFLPCVCVCCGGNVRPCVTGSWARVIGGKCPYQLARFAGASPVSGGHVISFSHSGELLRVNQARLRKCHGVVLPVTNSGCAGLPLDLSSMCMHLCVFVCMHLCCCARGG